MAASSLSTENGGPELSISEVTHVTELKLAQKPTKVQGEDSQTYQQREGLVSGTEESDSLSPLLHNKKWPAVLVTWKAETERIMVQDQSRQIVFKTLSPK
jgi:hypothetical protein